MSTTSVVLITYNQRRTIAEAIESVLAQRTSRPFELLVADDGSTDETPAIIKAFAARYPSVVKPVLRPKNLGAQQNFVETFNLCPDGYVALLEGDDAWLSPQKLELQLTAMDLNPEATLCGTNAVVFDERPPLKSSIYPAQRDGYLAGPEVILEANFFSTCTLVLRKRGLLVVPQALLPAWGDWALKLQFALQGAVLFLPEVTALYRVTGYGLWSGLTLAVQEQQVLRALHSFEVHLGEPFAPQTRARVQRQLKNIIATHRGDDANPNARAAQKELDERVARHGELHNQPVDRRPMIAPRLPSRPPGPALTAAQVDQGLAHAVGLLEAGSPAAGLAALEGLRLDGVHDVRVEHALAIASTQLGLLADAVAACRRGLQLAPDGVELFRMLLGLVERAGLLVRGHFLPALARRLDVDASGEQADNVDPYRFPAGPEQTPTLRDATVIFDALLDRAEALERTFSQFDEPSQALMLESVAFRVLGPRRVRLSRNDQAYWAALRRADQELAVERDQVTGRFPFPLHRFDLKPLGLPFSVLSSVNAVARLFLLQQYDFRRGAVQLGARAGEVVLDGGAGWGDGTLGFAHAVGPQGKVLAFEFHPDNLEVYRRNLALNPQLAERVWLAGDSAPIDQVVRDQALQRVDLIKLDLDGGEVSALEGAAETLRRHRPRLAVSVYSRDTDLAETHQFLDRLQLGYRFFLGHFTIHGEETVLFATAER